MSTHDALVMHALVILAYARRYHGNFPIGSSTENIAQCAVGRARMVTMLDTRAPRGFRKPSRRNPIPPMPHIDWESVIWEAVELVVQKIEAKS